jgi:hypothetical protein
MIEPVIKILKIFYENNLFEEGVELIGSWCFQLYVRHLGAKPFPLRTQDIDFLIPYPFKGKDHKDLIKQLEKIGFEKDFTIEGHLFLWNSDLKIEFLVPQKGKGIQRAIKIKNLEITAIPLRFVSLLLDNPITVREGKIEIKLPNPANFCLHKLLIVSRRRKMEKGLKDLQQAICTFSVVEKKYLQKVFIGLPKRWRIAVLKVLEKAKKELPLFKENIEEFIFTLQNAKIEEL